MSRPFALALALSPTIVMLLMLMLAGYVHGQQWQLLPYTDPLCKTPGQQSLCSTLFNNAQCVYCSTTASYYISITKSSSTQVTLAETFAVGPTEYPPCQQPNPQVIPIGVCFNQGGGFYINISEYSSSPAASSSTRPADAYHPSFAGTLLLLGILPNV